MEFLETMHLYLRFWQPEDAAALWSLAAERLLLAMGVPGPACEVDCVQEMARLAKSDVDYAIVEKETDRVIGIICIPHSCPPGVKPELPYRTLTFAMHPDFRGHHYMAEAMKEMVRHVFEDIGVGMLWSWWPEGGSGAKRLLEELDFQPELTQRDTQAGQTVLRHYMTLTWERWVKQWQEEQLFEMMMTAYY